ncbi:alcohol dehydrogenase zinc-binding domain protein [Hyaloscypha bicolor E]|uniref:Alcohol dehydrogenase zinc-binding domain protein n=1 Tax=Hyaloscypha bicolor E TaxID=1095630 RepID=A0A2J6SSM6_9HELO|nr:alcohol dehydrogenase zinc-binding domain protein [Hyaloscypha bicolor E]PMD53767.1 alcohol dehydrogenase zinc-binding domain protein [Hyaloscypha bicolor E]
MRAIFLSTPGKPSTYVFKDIPIPEALPGHAVIQVKAFGLNHAEVHMRKGEWPEIHEISGIECVGIVHSCAGNEFAVGMKVAAIMGGMGRTIPGSYAEYTRVRVGNVVSIESDLSWEELAAIPESYATAWSALFRNLELKEGQKLLIRGGTSSLGHAAVNLAVNAGARVTATTRNLDRAAILKDLGVHEVVLEGPELSERLPYKGFDTVLDLVGNSVVMDSLEIPHRGGRVCIAGWLGGLAPIKEFNPLLQMPTGVHLSFFGSPHFGMPGIEVSDVPMQKIVEDVAKGRYKAKPSQVFRFEDISKAHEALEHGSGNGKIVVKVSK